MMNNERKRIEDINYLLGTRSQSRRILFICSYGLVRSVAAENLFKKRGIAADHCGLYGTGMYSFARELNIKKLRWATEIVVMERKHATTLIDYYWDHVKDKDVRVLDIPDAYGSPDDPELLKVIDEKMGEFK